jgi:hypothetical protein
MWSRYAFLFQLLLILSSTTHFNRPYPRAIAVFPSNSTLKRKTRNLTSEFYEKSKDEQKTENVTKSKD